jgi:hypothetical protein
MPVRLGLCFVIFYVSEDDYSLHVSEEEWIGWCLIVTERIA